MKLWVLDTNAVVSAFLTPAGTSAHLLRAVSDGQIKLAYDQRILAEYREVLNRPSLRISPSVIAIFLASMRSRKMAGPMPPSSNCCPHRWVCHRNQWSLKAAKLHATSASAFTGWLWPQ
jgi:predicted nucleic acid-binding protein